MTEKEALRQASLILAPLVERSGEQVRTMKNHGTHEIRLGDALVGVGGSWLDALSAIVVLRRDDANNPAEGVR